LAATLAATLGGTVGGSPVAQAQAAPVVVDLVGNFTGDGREELFSYVSGSTPDYLVQFGTVAGPGSDVYADSYQFNVNSTYRPVAGQFDRDGYDEILWYAPGTAADYLWDFTGPSTFTSRPFTANGTYQPVVGDFTGDTVDDILWYAPGAAADPMWDYNPDGTRTSTTRTINGTYRPIVGSFGTDNTDDILWYAAGSTPDGLWDFRPNGTYANRTYAVSATYQPFSLDMYADGWRGEDIFWYAPGGPADYVWDFFQGQLVSTGPDPVGGVYTAVPGNFLGDGASDILWFNDSALYMWDHSPDGEGGVWRYNYTFGASSAASTLAAEDGVSSAEVVAAIPPTAGLSGSRQLHR
jgi:hypothetical protein